MPTIDLSGLRTPPLTGRFGASAFETGAGTHGPKATWYKNEANDPLCASPKDLQGALEHIGTTDATIGPTIQSYLKENEKQWNLNVEKVHEDAFRLGARTAQAAIEKHNKKLPWPLIVGSILGGGVTGSVVTWLILARGNLPPKSFASPSGSNP